MPSQAVPRSEEHTSELQSLAYIVCRLQLEKQNRNVHSLCMHPPLARESTSQIARIRWPVLFPNLLESRLYFSQIFFFNDTATTAIYTLSLHDALPISCRFRPQPGSAPTRSSPRSAPGARDRESTRLNSSHWISSYAGVCLKKKKT